MPDILKFIRDGDGAADDDFGAWDKDAAAGIADELGVTMTPEHWEVIEFLRSHHTDHGPYSVARKLSEVLDKQFSARGGSRHLYRLFPGGPVTQGCQIAGIPIPGHNADPSFGTVQ